MKWISIKDELPKKDQEVLCFVSDEMIQGVYNPGSKEWGFAALHYHGGEVGHYTILDEPSHWAELPPLPG